MWVGLSLRTRADRAVLRGEGRRRQRAQRRGARAVLCACAVKAVLWACAVEVVLCTCAWIGDA